MKKLMIAAAAAALVGGAFADDLCNAPCPYGYQIKVVLKTTSTKTVNDASTLCGDMCFRGPASLRLAGFIFGNTEEDGDICQGVGCACNDWQAANIVMWNYDTKAAAVFTEWKMLQLDRIFSRKLDSTMVEAAFDLDLLRFAGFGYVAKRDGKWTVKNLAGFCAGQIPQKCSVCSEYDICSGTCTGADDVDVKVWSICDAETAAPSVVAPYTVAYGKWTIDWSSTVYNKVYAKELVAGTAVAPGAGFEAATSIAITPAN